MEQAYQHVCKNLSAAQDEYAAANVDVYLCYNSAELAARKTAADKLYTAAVQQESLYRSQLNQLGEARRQTAAAALKYYSALEEGSKGTLQDLIAVSTAASKGLREAYALSLEQQQQQLSNGESAASFNAEVHSRVANGNTVSLSTMTLQAQQERATDLLKACAEVIACTSTFNGILRVLIIRFSRVEWLSDAAEDLVAQLSSVLDCQERFLIAFREQSENLSSSVWYMVRELGVTASGISTATVVNAPAVNR